MHLLPVDRMLFRDPSGTARAAVLVRHAALGLMLVWRYGNAFDGGSGLMLVPSHAGLNEIKAMRAENASMLLSGGRLRDERVEPLLLGLRDRLQVPMLNLRHIVQSGTGAFFHTFECTADMANLGPGVYWIAVLYDPSMDAFALAGELLSTPSDAVTAAQLRLFEGEVIVGVRAVQISSLGPVVTLRESLNAESFNTYADVPVLQDLEDRIGEVKRRAEAGEHKPKEAE